MTRTLHNRLDISDDLTLPIDVVTGTEAILATKGMGKTHLAQVVAEELLDHGQVFIAVDPTDAWWGLRSSADGKHDGYPVTIFGGSHGDMKLDPNAGVQIADLVIAGHSVVVCTRGLDDAQEVAIVTAIMRRLYRKNREPRKIFLDEADMFAPERMDTKGQSESLAAVRNIVKRGRNSGLGITLITQRSASINKDVLNLCDTLFVLGMESPLDIDPIDRWIRTKDEKKAELAAELVESLPVLPRGDAWAWNSRAKIHQRFRARAKRTFDSGGTPKVGQHKRVAKRLAQVDLAKLGDEIAQQVAAQRADDPVALREDLRRAQLEVKHLGIKLEAKASAYDQMQKAASEAQQRAAKPTKMVDPKKLARLVDGASKQLDRAELIVGRFESAGASAAAALTDVLQPLVEGLRAELGAAKVDLEQPTITVMPGVTDAKLTAAIAKIDEAKRRVPAPAFVASAAKSTTLSDDDLKASRSAAGDASPLQPKDVRVLNAIRWWSALGVDEPSIVAVALVARYSPSNSGFEKTRGQLRTMGLVTYPSAGTVRLTASGLAASSMPETPCELGALHASVMSVLDPVHGRVLAPLLDAYPKALDDEALAKAAGYSASNSGFEKAKGKLRSLGLVDYPQPKSARARAILFPSALTARAA